MIFYKFTKNLTRKDNLCQYLYFIAHMHKYAKRILRIQFLISSCIHLINAGVRFVQS